MKPKVLIIVGSDSDIPLMRESKKVLKGFGIPFSLTVASAHRSPHYVMRLAEEADAEGVEVIIAGAGMSAHLAGVIASHTILPVIGVPIPSSHLNGLDSLLSIVQMPAGVPVATMSVGKPGAKNAAIYAVEILSRKNPKLKAMLYEMKRKMADEIEKRSKRSKQGSQKNL